MFRWLRLPILGAVFEKGFRSVVCSVAPSLFGLFLTNRDTSCWKCFPSEYSERAKKEAVSKRKEGIYDLNDGATSRRVQDSTNLRENGDSDKSHLVKCLYCFAGAVTRYTLHSPPE